MRPRGKPGAFVMRGGEAMATNTTARGYGADHQKERRRWEPTVKAGKAKCARCGEDIDPAGPWDLGHNDDRTQWTGPEHVKCNRGAGARNAVAVRVQRNQMTVREW